MGEGRIRRNEELIKHWKLAHEDSKRAIFNRKQLGWARGLWLHPQDSGWRLMQSQNWTPTAIAWLQRWNWSPSDYQASLNIVPGHIRRRQRRKARRAGLTTEPDSSSEGDDLPTFVTIDD